MSTILSAAVKDGVLTINPAQGAIVTEPALKPPTPRILFSPEQLGLIFGSPIFTASFRPRGGGGEASCWLPILAHYSGARLEEMAQLYIQDVKFAAGLGWYLDIYYDNKRRLKTESSVRRIPLRDEVVALGFLDYVEQMRTAESLYLFPDLHPDTKGVRSGNWSKWFGRYLVDPEILILPINIG